jgi:hypothetical protein
MKIKVFFIITLIIALTGCGYSTKAMLAPNKNLNNFKTAYLESPTEDEFNLRYAVTDELMKMGYSVKSGKPENPSDEDVIVRYSYYPGWDLVKIVKNFQVQFVHARTGEIIATGSYENRPFHFFHREGAVKLAFDALKEKIVQK